MCSSKRWVNNFFVFVLMLMPMVSFGQQWLRSMVVDGKLYVYTDMWNNTTSTSERKLWVYDGTNSPTVLKEFESNQYMDHLQSVDNKLVIFTSQYSSGNSQYKIWVYDPSADTVPIEKVTLSSHIGNLLQFNDKLYFTSYSSSSHYLYSFDGSDITNEANLGHQWPRNLIGYDGKIFFNKYAGSNGTTSTYTFYSYNGTDLTAGKTIAGSPSEFIEFNDKLYLSLIHI